MLGIIRIRETPTQKLTYADQLRAQILALIKQRPGITTESLSTLTGAKRTKSGSVNSTVRRVVNELESEGLIAAVRDRFACFRDSAKLYPAGYQIPQPKKLPQMRSRELETLKIYRVDPKEIHRYIPQNPRHA